MAIDFKHSRRRIWYPTWENHLHPSRSSTHEPIGNAVYQGGSWKQRREAVGVHSHHGLRVGVRGHSGQTTWMYVYIYIFTYPGIPKTIETIIGFQWLSPRTIFCREFESSKIGDYYLDDLWLPVWKNMYIHMWYMIYVSMWKWRSLLS